MTPSELRKLAEAATKGPWMNNQHYECIHSHSNKTRLKPVVHYSHNNDTIVADAAFVAAANPATILALLDRLEKLERVAEAANRLEHAASIVALADNSSFNPEANNLRFALDLVRQSLSDLRKLPTPAPGEKL